MSRRNRIRTLTAKELLFVQLYVGNASLAAQQAGYKSPRVLGAKLMRRPEVAKAIQQKQEKAIAVAGEQLGRLVTITRDDIISGPPTSPCTERTSGPASLP